MAGNFFGVLIFITFAINLTVTKINASTVTRACHGDHSMKGMVKHIEETQAIFLK